MTLIIASTSAATKRAEIVSGKRGAPAVNLTGLSITPLDPISPDTQNRLQLDTPFKMRETYTEGDYDIVDGDILTVDSVDYPVRAVEKYEWDTTHYLHLIVEVVNG